MGANMAAKTALGNSTALAVPDGQQGLLYYNIRSNPRNAMSSQPHRHRHPVIVPASILRMSVLERLAVAGAVIALIWAAVFWAMS